MLSKIKTACISGLNVSGVEVETDISKGLPVVNIVGLVDLSVRESKERVRAAIKNSLLEFPLKRITINLSPADQKKEGSQFDLPIALGILVAMGNFSNYDFPKTIILGELSLDGKVNKINAVLPMLLEMHREGFRRAIIPYDNLQEAKLVKDMECIGIKSLKEAIDYVTGKKLIRREQISEQNLCMFEEETDDFKDLYGQESLKRALEIAAAGNHNLLMVGPPGSGKTMAAKRVASILPKLTFEEALEITKIYSVAGLLDTKQGLIRKRPFRAPHHTASMMALTGGGRMPKPGEISLSHFGVLFLDELPEFNKNALEVLRQPLEEKKITVARVNGTFTYPAEFMLICAMNPCPCGYYSSTEQQACKCSPHEINRYMGKISGPLLDRMDLLIETTGINYSNLVKPQQTENSKTIRERVQKAREIQTERYKGTKTLFNSQLTASEIKKFCKLDEESLALMKDAFEKMKLSARGYTRTIKVSRTIADLAGSYDVQLQHLAEALQYRNISIISRR